MIQLDWDHWGPELLTDEGDVFPIGPNGLPVVDLVGRTANQYIWLAYALRIGAEALRPNHHDGYCLADIPHRLAVLPPTNWSNSYGSRWNKASHWKNLLGQHAELQELFLVPGMEEIQAISLHARLDDKMGNGDYMPFTREFAEEALSRMPGNLPVNVFSDSPVVAKELLEGLRPLMNFLSGGSARNDFLHISAHAFQIVPDSTFSWMAAFLSPFRQRVVCLTDPERDGDRHEFPDFLNLRGDRTRSRTSGSDVWSGRAPNLIPPPSKSMPEVLVTSPGGMGCTYVIESLSGFKETNLPDDSDGLKHCPDPMVPNFSGVHGRVIYVWNDPLKAILSHHRRGWFSLQCRKLDGAVEAAGSLESLWRACISAGTDIYGLLKHAEHWLTCPRWPVFFLDLRRLEEEKPDLGAFLGVRIDHMALRSRTDYDLGSIPVEIRDIYQAIDHRVTLLGRARNAGWMTAMEAKTRSDHEN